MSDAIQPQSVLIVDASPESREVLRTILERQGTRIYEASGAREGLELVRQHHPAVIVLDLEAEAADDEQLQRQLDLHVHQDGSSLVVLGRTTRYADCLPRERVVSKPYHYAPLLRTIERLLESSKEQDTGASGPVVERIA